MEETSKPTEIPEVPAQAVEPQTLAPKTQEKSHFILFFILLLAVISVIAIIGAPLGFQYFSPQAKTTIKSKQETKSFTEISKPTATSIPWISYFDPTSTSSANLGCYGNLAKTKLIKVHTNDSPPDNVNPDVLSGTAKAILDTDKKILYITVMANIQTGTVGYIQLRDSEDESEKPLFEKKTSTDVTSFMVEYNKSLESELLNGKVYLAYYFGNATLRGFYKNGSSDAGHLNDLLRCTTKIKLPILKVTSPTANVSWKEGQSHDLIWDIHYPEDSTLSPKNFALTIYISPDDGSKSGGGAITYDGSAHEGSNYFTWLINKRIPLLSSTKKYIITFSLKDSSMKYSAPYVVYSSEKITGITIENNPNVTSTN